MVKRKYYVVWEGREKGIFDSWAECATLVQGYNGAKYKSFATREEACEAFRRDYWDVVKGKAEECKKSAPDNLRQGIAVDAACSGNPDEWSIVAFRLPPATSFFIRACLRILPTISANFWQLYMGWHI